MLLWVTVVNVFKASLVQAQVGKERDGSNTFTWFLTRYTFRILYSYVLLCSDLEAYVSVVCESGCIQMEDFTVVSLFPHLHNKL